MDRPVFLLSHIDLAHSLWLKHLRPGNNVIDATCGRGKDALLIAKNILSNETGKLVCMDIQDDAISSTKNLLKDHLSPQQFQRVEFCQQSHIEFPQFLETIPIHLIIYNLGYLPGGKKSITTMTSSTLLSLDNALKIITPGGLISITCYPGHDEGLKEYQKIILWTEELDKNLYKSAHYRSISHPTAPSVLFVVKN